MDKDILCQLIAQRINPEYFFLSGIEFCWKSEDYNTEANNAIVAGIIANYDSLAADYEAAQVVIRKRQAYKTEADPLYIEWKALLAAEDADAEARHQEWIAKRAEIKARFE
ncbi:MAG: hypothetical protein CVU71_03605 [Deltaproteobacteria bacterium HGW-Deltaproteobacteria-6]|jgi:hypothetical protein|nr:MAG: hypothetical protein CVU71_03605 [Deltaproteobacteria bacterium HGW-Deltaproteobacteria-6]